MVFGGQTPPAPSNSVTAENESWNGSSWTETGNINTARNQFAGVGTNTAALGFGGRQPGRNETLTESWNGSAWTELSDLNTGRENMIGAGEYTNAIAFGGRNGGPDAKLGNSETWNGSAWREVNELNTAREQLGGA